MAIVYTAILDFIDGNSLHSAAILDFIVGNSLHSAILDFIDGTSLHSAANCIIGGLQKLSPSIGGISNSTLTTCIYFLIYIVSVSIRPGSLFESWFI